MMQIAGAPTTTMMEGKAGIACISRREFLTLLLRCGFRMHPTILSSISYRIHLCCCIGSLIHTYFHHILLFIIDRSNIEKVILCCSFASSFVYFPFSSSRMLLTRILYLHISEFLDILHKYLI